VTFCRKTCRISSISFIEEDHLQQILNEECNAPENDAPPVGLGLYVSRNIVGNLGGHIEANNPKGGVVFIIYLIASEEYDLERDLLSEEKENVEAIAGG